MLLTKHKLLYQSTLTSVKEETERGACEAITRVFALLGKRWSGLIIVSLLDGPVRFSELVRLVPGLSERMLAARLGELTAAGLVERDVEGGPPVSVRYGLTERGEALRPALAELERWGQEQLVPARLPAPGPSLPVDLVRHGRPSQHIAKHIQNGGGR
jgi:DNA-binding HxlR family transcriptional regulator